MNIHQESTVGQGPYLLYDGGNYGDDKLNSS